MITFSNLYFILEIKFTRAETEVLLRASSYEIIVKTEKCSKLQV